MFRLNKKYYKILIFIFIFLGIVLLLAQWVAEYSVKDFLERKIPPHFVLRYDDLDINVLSGSVRFDEVSLEIINRDSLQVHTLLKLESLVLEGVGYMQLLFNKTVALNEVVLQKPELNYYPYKYSPTKNDQPKGIVNLRKTISLEKLAIQEGSFHLMKDATDSIQVSIKNYNFIFYG